MELFLNPWYMVAGGAMVSSPILIHLINRMRFKRIRWAAMEFLLKSQKRNRRRLIIEQLILLLLRCLLVLLAAFLVARFVGQALGMTQTASTTHVVLFDDTLSMNDRAPKDKGPGPDAFTFAKTQVELLAKHASEANSAQYLQVITLSDRQKIFDERLNDESLKRLSNVLRDLKPTVLAGDTIKAVEEAKKKLDASKESKRWLHIVSDFRDLDWGRRGANDKLHELLQEACASGIDVTLIDCAAPERAPGASSTVDSHFNYAISDLRPEKRIAPASTTVPFSIELKNFGSDSREQVFLEVYVNGKQDFEASHYYPAPPPGGDVRHSFDLLFDGPGEGQRSRFHRVTVKLMANQGQKLDAESGLLADNVRHAVIEIRKAVPTLLIDGNPEEGDRPGGDRRTIQTALESLKGTDAVQVVKGTIDTLSDPKLDLEREFATIWLLNVENLKGRKDKDGKGEDRPLERLRQFIRNGGNVVFFMGDKVDMVYYNKVLFEKNEGLFPVPLAAAASREMEQAALQRLRNSRAPKIFVLDAEHDITRGIAPYQFVPDLLIPRFAVAKERFEWEPKWSPPGALKELIALANPRELDDTARQQASRLVKRLPISDKKYGKLLEKHRKLIEDAYNNGRADELFRVAEAFDKLLTDRGDKPGDKDNISLVDFWKLPEHKDLKTDILNFRKDSLYGSPLVVSRRVGKGNVVAFLTTAGTKWSGWPGDNPKGSGGLRLGGVASTYYPIVITDLQRYLTKSLGSDSRLVGDTLRFELDPVRYNGTVQRFFQIDEGQLDVGREPAQGAPLGFRPEPEKTVQQDEGKYVVSFDPVKQAGVQIVKLTPSAKDAPAEERWFAFNVNTAAESNLRRVGFDEVVRNPTEVSAGRGKIQGPFKPGEAQDTLRQRQRDLSESPWLYLLFLLVLIAEQALAVHLSFHVRGAEGSQPASRPSGTAAEPAAAA